MSLIGSLVGATGGMNAQAAALSAISDNVANSQTVGFKETDTTFSDYVTQSSATAHAPGAVEALPQYSNSIEGVVTQVSNPTSLAISGNGFFPVQRPIGATSFNPLPYYTRVGDFSPNKAGYMVNSTGYALDGFPATTTAGVTSFNTNALAPIQISQAPSDPVATSNITVAANIPASVNGSDTFTMPALAAGQSITIAGRTVTAAATVTATTGSAANIAAAFASGANSTDLTVSGALPQASTGAAAYTVSNTGSAVAFTSTQLGNVSELLATASTGAAPTALPNTGALGAAAVTSSSTPATKETDIFTMPSLLNAGQSITINGQTVTASAPIAGTAVAAAFANGASSPGLTISGTAGSLFSVVNASGVLTYTAVTAGLTTAAGVTATTSASAITAPTATFVQGTTGQTYTSTIQTYDAGGNAQPVTLNWVNTAPNDWNLTITAAGATPSTASVGPLAVTFGSTPATAGMITSIGTAPNANIPTAQTTGFPATVTIPSLNFGFGAQPVTLNLGNFGQSNGITQFAGTSYAVASQTADGAPPGNYSGVTIQPTGEVVINYDNGSTKTIAKIPLATFNSPDSLQQQDGQAFTPTTASGTSNLVSAGTDGAGTMIVGAEEGSNVDIATQFTQMIVAQRAYTANSKVISTANSMLQDALNMIQG